MSYESYSLKRKKEVDGWIKDMREGTKELTDDPKKARAFLIKHGFITKNNKLTKRYGG